MAFKASSLRLLRPSASHKATVNGWPKHAPLFAPVLAPRRTLFGFGRSNDPPTQVPSNPVLDDYLKRKPQGPPKIERGGLAESSIFEEEEPRPAPGKPKGKGGRNPNSMAAALDPIPGNRKRWERKMVIQEIRRRGRLSKTALLKRTERQNLSKSHWIKTSVKKLSPLARQIQGKSVDDAITQMRFSRKRAAQEVRQHLIHARNEAIVQRGMGLGEAEGRKGEPVEIELKSGKRRRVTDRTDMYVDQAWVGRGPFDFEMNHRARGVIDLLRLPYTSMSVLLKEEATRVRQSEEMEEKRRNRKLWVHLPHRPITAQRQYYCW